MHYGKCVLNICFSLVLSHKYANANRLDALRTKSVHGDIDRFVEACYTSVSHDVYNVCCDMNCFFNTYV